MGKTEHNPPKKLKPSFIAFNKVQQNYLIEVRNRQLKEFNEAVNIIFEQLGIVDRIRKAPPGTYKLRMQDLSGVDILPIKKNEKDN